MTITIYVDFRNEEVYSEKEYEEAICQMVENSFNGEEVEYCWSFDDWMDDEGYTSSEIFHLNENEKEDIVQKYKEYANSAIRSYWNCEEKEITI